MTPIFIPLPMGGSSGGGPPVSGREMLTVLGIVVSIALGIIFLMINLVPISGRPQETEGKIVQVLPSKKGHLYRDLILEIDGVRYASVDSVSKPECQLGKIAWGFIETYWVMVPAWTTTKIDVRICRDPR